MAENRGKLGSVMRIEDVASDKEALHSLDISSSLNKDFHLWIETCDLGAFCVTWGNARYLIGQAYHYLIVNIIK